MAWTLLITVGVLVGLPALVLLASLIPRLYLFRRQGGHTRYCLGCRYDLNHNTTGRCPECGQPIPAKQRAYLRSSSDRT